MINFYIGPTAVPAVSCKIELFSATQITNQMHQSEQWDREFVCYHLMEGNGENKLLSAMSIENFNGNKCSGFHLRT